MTMSTTVLFCDLCNESVPQADLDAGRAVLVNGRVVCATCDRLMSSPEPAGAAFASAGPALPAWGAPSATPSAASAPVSEGLRGRARGERSVAGAGLAALAVLFTLGVGWKLNQKIEEGQLKYDATLARYVAQYQEATRDVRATSRELGASNETWIAQVTAGLEEHRQDLADAERRWQRESDQMLAELHGFGGELAKFQELAGLIQRHDKEMVGLQAKFAGLQDDLSRQGERLGTLEKRPVIGLQGALPADPAEGAAAAAAPAAAPAWGDLLGGLRSADASERWLAVDELGQTGDPAVAEHLVPMLTDEDTFVRMATARILGELAAPAGIPALIGALEDSEAAVREAAMVALQAATGNDLKFDPHAAPAERAKKVKLWQQWWERAAADFGK